MNKNFETIEQIICETADRLYQPVYFPEYSELLAKEHAELQAELNNKAFLSIYKDILENENMCFTDEILERCKDELADVLVFTLRISNAMECNGKDLLLHALKKMINRIDNPNYNKP